MVAILSGNGLGLSTSSASVLGQQGVFGNAVHGRTNQSAYLNIANGNLSLQDRDDFLAAQGIDLALTRTYNSQGNFNDRTGANWKIGLLKQISGLTGAVNTEGSTVTRIDGDGSSALFRFDAGRNAYLSTDGGGAYQALAYDAGTGQWTWMAERRDLGGLSEVYDGGAGGRIVTLRDALGVRLSYQYDAAGRVNQVTDGSGDQTCFDYDLRGNIAQIRTVLTGTAQNFVRVRYSYDEQDRLIVVTTDLTPEDGSISDGRVYSTSYTYDGDSNRIARMAQSDGTSLDFSYALAGGEWKLATVTDALGRRTAYDYTVAGQTTVTDPLNNTSVYRYDAQGQLTEVSAPAVDGIAQIGRFYYDASGNLERTVDPRGLETVFTYDANGNRISQRDASGHLVTRTYDAASNKLLTETTMVRGEAFTARFAYDGGNRLRFQVTAEGRVTEYRYNAAGERSAVLQYNDALYSLAGLAADTAAAAASLAGWVERLDKSSASRTDYAYDGRGLMSAQTTYARLDAAGEGIADGQESVQRYVYDQAGQLLQSIDANLSPASYAYDGLGRVLSSIDALNNQTVTTYDDANYTSVVRYAGGLARRSVYDKTGQLIDLIESDSNNVELGRSRFHYDPAGRLLMAQNPAGQRTFKLYDEAGRVTADIDADGSLTEYAYNADNQVGKTVQYANLVKVAALIDADGKPLAPSVGAVRPAASALDRSSWNSYDTAGRLSESVDAKGYLTRRVYDGASRLVLLVQRATPIDLAQLDGVTAPASFVQADSPDDRITRSFYDKDGNLTGVLDAEGYLTENIYDAGGRLAETVRYQAVTAPATRGSDTLAGLRPADTANDSRQRYLYNNKGRLEGVIDAASFLTETSYDRNGNVLRTTRHATPVAWRAGASVADLRPAMANPGDRVHQFGYTRLNQLESEIAPGGTSTVYRYDRSGNLVSSEVQLASSVSGVQRRFDEQGRVVAELGPDAVSQLAGAGEAHIKALWDAYAVKYTYDAAGNRTSMTDPLGNRSLFYYDADGRLSYSVNAMGEVQGQRYNAFNQLERSTRFHNRIAAATLATLKGGQADADLEVIAAALASEEDSVQSYVYDARGQAVDQVDALGNHSSAEYDAYGAVAAQRRFAAEGSVVANARDASNRTVYDKDGRVAAVLTGSGAVTSFQYDANGNVTERISYATALDPGSSIDAVKAAIANKALEVGQRQRFVYDALGRASAVLTALAGVQWSLLTQSYDSNGNLSASTAYATALSSAEPTASEIANIARAGSDAMVRYAYDSAGRLSVVATAQRLLADSQREWSIVAKEYDAAGNLIASTALATSMKALDPTPADLAAFAGSASANRTPGDAVTRLVYDSSNRVIATATAQGANEAGVLQWAVVGQRYDAAGNLVEQSQYAKPLTAATLPASPSPADYARWIAGVVAAPLLDRTSRFTYDAAGRLDLSIDATGAVSQTSYDAKGNAVLRTAFKEPYVAGQGPTHSPGDHVLRSFYDRANRPVFDIDGLGGITEHRYDPLGNVVATVRYKEPIASETLAGLVTAGDVKDRLRPDANDRTERYVHDQAQRLRYTIDAAGYIRETQYDALGRVSTTLAYEKPVSLGDTGVADAVAAAATAQLARARINHYQYDAQGHVISSTDALNNTESYTYDALGRKTTLTNRRGATWDYTYDAAGRLVQEKAPETAVHSGVVTGGDQGTDGRRTYGFTLEPSKVRLATEMTYDTFGNVASRTEAAGTPGQRKTLYFYDLAGRQVRTELPETAIYNTAEDVLANGQAGDATRAEVTATLSIEVRYDMLGNAVSNKDVGGQLTYKAYDSLGRVRYATDAAGYVTGYQRDNFGNVVGLTRYANTPPLSTAGSSDADAIETALRPLDHTRDRTIRTGYDVLGRTLTVIEPRVASFGEGGSTERYTARTTEFTYNAFGETIKQAVYGLDDDKRQLGQAQESYSFFDQRGYQQAQISVVRTEGDKRIGYVTTMDYDAAGNVRVRNEYAGEYVLTAEALAGKGFGVPDAQPNNDRKVSYTYDFNNRKISETHVTVTGGVDSVATPRSLTTSFGYDALGNQTVVTDALGNSTYTSYNELGRVTAILTDQAGTDASPLTEFKLDAYGNVVQRIEYANGAAGASDADRKTSTVFDRAGHALQTVDAEGNAAFMSYDAYGRVAKQWQRVSTNPGAPETQRAATVFKVLHYDALGHLVQVDSPDVRNAIDPNAVTTSVSSQITDYNAFGEVIKRSIADSKGTEQYAFTAYDAAGRVWRTNEGDGVYKVTLYDTFGNAITEVRSTASGTNALATAASTQEAIKQGDLTRSNIRYDLMGRAVESSQGLDAWHYTLQKDGANNWVKVPLTDGSAPDSLLVVADAIDAKNAITVQYRVSGSNDWIDGAGRMLKLGDYSVFNTAGLGSGDYEYKVYAQRDSEDRYERASGTLRISAGESTAKNTRIAQLYGLILNRAPELAAMNFWIGIANGGTALSAIALSILNSPEAAPRAAGSADAVIRRIFLDAFGRGGAADDTTYEADVARWAGRYAEAAARQSDERGQVLVDMLDELLAYSGPSAAVLTAQARVTNRANAVVTYLTGHGGNDPVTAARIFASAATDLAAALADAEASATLEMRRPRIFQLYLALLGRAADADGVQFWLAAMGNNVSPDAMAGAMLDSAEANHPSLYPRNDQRGNPLTPDQYNRQLVARIYQNMLGRAPTAAEADAWLAKLAGAAITAGQFALQLIDAVAGYAGTDPALLDDKTRFNDRVAIAQAYTALGRAEDGVSRAIIGAVTSAASAKAAADAAVLALAASSAAAAASAASIGLAGATMPMEEMRLQASRLYAGLLNSAPDKPALDYYFGLKLSSPAEWASIATGILSSPEASGDPALFPPGLGDAQFVARVYTNALGRLPAPPGAALAAEMAGFVQQLAGGASRGAVALGIVNGLLRFDNLSPDEAALKAGFSNKAAVGVAYALYLDMGGNPDLGRDIGKIAAETGVRAALDYAYTKVLEAIRAHAPATGAAAESGQASVTAASSAVARAVAAAAANAAAMAAAAGLPSALQRLQLVQLYVGVLGRSANLAGIEFYVDALERSSLDAVARGFFESPEGQALYPASLSAEEVVAKIFETVLGQAGLGQAQVAGWAQKLRDGTLDRGQVALGIIDSVLKFDNASPDASAVELLKAKLDFSVRVATALNLVDAEATKLLGNDPELLKEKKAELDAAAAGLHDLTSTRDGAVAAAAAARDAATAAIGKADGVGDHSGSARRNITLLYATLLQRAEPPTLDELDFWVGVPLATAAQSMIDSPEARASFPADPTGFVTALYQRILGRAPDPAGLRFWLDNVGAGMTRGEIAAAMLTGLTSYSDNTPDLLWNKYTLDQKIQDFLWSANAEAEIDWHAAADEVARRELQTAETRAYHDTAVGARDARAAELNAAVAQAADAIDVLKLASHQQTVTRIYIALRGYTDFGGLAWQMRAMASGATSPARLIDDLLGTTSFPTEPAAFIRALYHNVLGRDGGAAEIDWWVSASAGQSRAAIVQMFLDSPEGTAHLGRIVDDTVAADTATAHATIARRDAAIASYKQAVADVDQAMARYQDATAVEAPARARAAAAEVRASSAFAIASAHMATVDADLVAVDAAKAQTKSADAQAKYDGLKSAYDDRAASLAGALAAADASHAAAVAGQARADSTAASVEVRMAEFDTPMAARQATLVTRLSLTLLGRAPSVDELRVWSGQLGAGTTAAQIADAMMNGSEAMTRGLYPPNMSDDAFVTQLYRLGLDHAPDADGLRYWTGQLAGPSATTRAELAAAWIDSVVLSNNNDTIGQNGKVFEALRQVAAQVATLLASPDLAPFITRAIDEARDGAARADAAAVQAAAGDPRAHQGAVIARAYLALLNRIPDGPSMLFWTRAMGTGVTPSQLAEFVVSSPEGEALYGGKSNSEFITAVFQNALERAPTETELGTYSAQLASAGRGQVANSIIDDITSGGTADLISQATKIQFDAKVVAALGAAAAAVLEESRTLDTASQVAREIAASNPVDRYADRVRKGIESVTVGGGVAHYGSTRTQLDRWGNPILVTDPRNANWYIKYTYNADNQQLSTSRAAGVSKEAKDLYRVNLWATTATEYDGLGRVVATTDARGNGNRIKYDYDEKGKSRVEETRADGGVVTSVYNLFGDRLYVQQPDTAHGRVQTNYAYDNLGHLTESSSEASVAVYRTKIIEMPPEASEDPDAPLPEGLGTLSAYEQGRQQLTEHFTYDELGRRVSSTNAALETTRMAYDLDGNVTAVTDARLQTTRMGYDSLHHRLEQVDANGKTLAWAVNSFGRVAERTDMSGVSTVYEYDNAGHLVWQHAKDGKEHVDNREYAVNRDSEKRQDIRYSYERGLLAKIEDSGTSLVTTYSYDLAGNRLTEKQTYVNGVSAPQRHVVRDDKFTPVDAVQNNTLEYDLQNRLVDVRDNFYHLKYEYDLNGNRTMVRTEYADVDWESVESGGFSVSVPHLVRRDFTVYNDYDKMNRQTVVNGDRAADGTVHRGSTIGHLVAYDLAGNRTSDTYTGTRVSVAGGSYATTLVSETKETFAYDGVGRLSTITRDGMMDVDTRHYDAAGRLIESGFLTEGNNVGKGAMESAAKAMGLKAERRISSYDGAGRIAEQWTYGFDSLQALDHTTLNLDNVGNLTGYQKAGADGTFSSNTYYALYDTYKEAAVSVSGNGASNQTTSVYDANGNRVKVLENGGKVRTTLWYDADGHVQAKEWPNEVASFSLIVNGQVLGNEDEREDNILGSSYEPSSSPVLAAPPTVYRVERENESLPSIAQSVWGDAKLWYLIADANGLDSNTKLEVGRILEVPSRINTVHNDYNTFKPYNPSEAIGNTAPALPAPVSMDDGCGVFGTIIMVVVAIVVTYITENSEAGRAAGSWVASLFGGSQAVASAATLAVSAAAGSAASQAVGVAIGAQDEFSWAAVALAAVSAGAAVGVDKVGASLDFWARAALSNAITQGIGVATGLQPSFSWKGVVAAAITAPMREEIIGKPGTPSESAVRLSGAEITRRAITGIATGTMTQALVHGRVDFAQVAADAFGNALVSSLAENMKPEEVENPYSIGKKTLSGAEKLAQGGSGTSFAGYSAEFLRNEATKEAEARSDAYMDSLNDPYLLTAARGGAVSGRPGKPMDLVKRANEISYRPQGSEINPNDLKSVYAQLRGAQADPNTTELERSYVTSAIRSIHQRGVTENILGVDITEQMARDGAFAPGAGGMKLPGVRASNVLPRTESEHVPMPAQRASALRENPLRAGQLHEVEQLATLGMEKNSVVFRPNQEQVDSAAFKLIVGDVKYTKGGQMKGTIFDSVDNGNLEIKGGTSELNRTYQLSLQTYKSLIDNRPFTIQTTRPVNPQFQTWLDSWGVNVVKPSRGK